MNLSSLVKKLTSLKNDQQKEVLQKFFKTGKGQYGEGDIFLGIKIPVLRQVSKEFKDLELNNVEKLLHSKIHEHRLTAVFILVLQYNLAIKDGDTGRAKQIYNFYLKNAQQVNNWDLVDLSAPNIVGHYLLTNDRRILYKLAKSKNLWENRIAMLATFAFIKRGDFEDVFKLAKIYLSHKHDLMHKAVGWMLREVGKRNMSLLKKFINKHYFDISRTTLRYAIERFPEVERKKYLNLAKKKRGK